MNLDHLHAIVVGGATAGAASALLLARAGAQVTLFERVAEPRAVGAGIALAANGIAVLESLGLGPALFAAGMGVPAPAIVDGRRRTLYAPPQPAARVLMLRRSALHTLLLDAVVSEPRITCRFGDEVIGARADGSVLTHRGELTGDLVIGADGVHSRIRSAGDFGARITPPGIAYLRTLVEGQRALGEEAWTAGGIFGSFDVPGGTYLYASAGSAATAGAVLNRDLAALRSAWARAYPASAPLLAAVPRFDDLIFNRVIRIACARWFDGRLVLVGDAAHAMPPNLGQGANSALVDAAVLLDSLRRHTGLAPALAAFQARRQPAVRWVTGVASRLGAMAELTHPILRGLRNRVVLPLAARVARDATTRVLQEPATTLLAIGSGS